MYEVFGLVWDDLGLESEFVVKVLGPDCGGLGITGQGFGIKVLNH